MSRSAPRPRHRPRLAARRKLRAAAGSRTDSRRLGRGFGTRLHRPCRVGREGPATLHTSRAGRSDDAAGPATGRLQPRRQPRCRPSPQARSLDTDAPLAWAAPPADHSPAIPPPGSNGGDRHSDSGLLAAFLSGLAVDGAASSAEDPAAMMRTAGEIVRASVEGLMAVLAARREIKGELRLTATEFKPTRNNPLKFSPEAQDAILQLLVRRDRGFLEPKAAVVEAFADIKRPSAGRAGRDAGGVARSSRTVRPEGAGAAARARIPAWPGC